MHARSDNYDDVCICGVAMSAPTCMRVVQRLETCDKHALNDLFKKTKKNNNNNNNLKAKLADLHRWIVVELFDLTCTGRLSTRFVAIA